LLRAAAGLWTAGQGRIARPPAGRTLFLPQQPYLRRGPLRDQLLYGLGKNHLTDGRVLEVLEAVGFAGVLGRLGGLNAEQDWGSVLSAGEQQVVAFARLLLAAPRFAFLDEAVSVVGEEGACRLYATLSRTPTAFISVSSDPVLRRFHDTALELGRDGAWAVAPVPAGADSPRTLPPPPRPVPAVRARAG
jgi:putative ATP-binding cassette transporter